MQKGSYVSGWYLKEDIIHSWDGDSSTYKCGSPLAQDITRYYPTKTEASKNSYKLCAVCATKRICASPTPADAIVSMIFGDLQGRAGFKELLEIIRPEYITGMRNAWIKHIENILE